MLHFKHLVCKCLQFVQYNYSITWKFLRFLDYSVKFWYHIHNTSCFLQLTNCPNKLERHITVVWKCLSGTNTTAYWTPICKLSKKGSVVNTWMSILFLYLDFSFWATFFRDHFVAPVSFQKYVKYYSKHLPKHVFEQEGVHGPTF